MLFHTFKFAPLSDLLSQFKLKVSHIVFKILFVCVCVCARARGPFPAPFCPWRSKSGVWPLGRSREGTKPCQADLSTSRASLWSPLPTFCSPGVKQASRAFWGAWCLPHHWPAPHSSETWHWANSMLFRNHLSPLTKYSQKAFLLREKLMKRTGWK